MQRGTAGLKHEWVMPDEGNSHDCTWMSFGATRRIWGRKLIGEVRRNLATLAQEIAKFEPVRVCVRGSELELAKRQFGSLNNIEFVECELDDLWIRDYGAVYVLRANGGKAAVDFNFNGWGEKQAFSRDSKVAAKMATVSKVDLLKTDICLEGGGIEVDGEGTAIITESCMINPNRNPGWTKADCEQELFSTLGIEKVIWLPGVRGADITDGHTDFYARFTRPGVVAAHFDSDKTSPENLLTRRHMRILRDATDAKGRSLKVIPFESPSVVRQRFDNDDFCAGYINFYVCNNAVFAPEFGDSRNDGAAKDKLQDCFPDREIIMINIDGIAAGGGGIHCATQQEPTPLRL